MRWLDYRLPPRLSIAYGSGAAYDSSPAGIRDARRARLAEWRDTVRFHRDLIDRSCTEAGHVPAPLKKPVITLDVLV